MQTTEFGRLTEINVRDLWPHEQYDFSNWLKASRILYSIPGLNFDVPGIAFGYFLQGFDCIKSLRPFAVSLYNNHSSVNGVHSGNEFMWPTLVLLAIGIWPT